MMPRIFYNLNKRALDGGLIVFITLKITFICFRVSIFLYLDTPSRKGSRDEGEGKNKKTSDFSFTHELTSDKGTCRNQH